MAAVALVGDAKKELFSWILTYAEETFPLTQFCRVCALDDWTELDLQTRNESALGVVNPIWSSLVLGEMLGQVDEDPDVAGVPLARAPACFSFAFARSALLYPKHKIAEARCIERLTSAERDPRFGLRHISVETFKKVWSVALLLQEVPNGSANLIETVIQVVAAINRQAAQLLKSNDLLLSDFAEDRVVGFDVIVDTIFDKSVSDDIGREGCAVALAAASLMAGRGTSHIKLLAPTVRLLPETLVWYGLLAGVLGPQSWDKAWMQQTKGVERALRQFFRPDEPVAADICWPEYEWLFKTYDSLEILSTIPRNSPRSLIIEILPGVICQFRLVGQRPNVRAHDERSPAETESSDITAAIRENAIARATVLLAEVQQILRPQGAGKSSQGKLFENEPSAKKERQTRSGPRNKSSKKQG